jgi:DNA-binding NarL/FixJ family response regulator
MSVKVSVVENDPGTLSALVNLIGGWPGLSCLGGHGSGTEALQAIPALRPDVVVVDLHLGDMPGVRCIAELKRQLPQTAILVYSLHQERDWIFPALQAGACGYIVKGGPPSDLLDAIAAAHRGEFPLDTSVRREVLNHIRQGGLASPAAPLVPEPDPANPCEELVAAAAAWAGLGRQEVVILEMIGQDEAYKGIAAKLGLSERTINNRVGQILLILAAKSPAEAVRKYLSWKSGIVLPPRDPQ